MLFCQLGQAGEWVLLIIIDTTIEAWLQVQMQVQAHDISVARVSRAQKAVAGRLWRLSHWPHVVHLTAMPEVCSRSLGHEALL